MKVKQPTKKEQEAEIERMHQLWVEWGRIMKPYTGEIKEIDLHAEWYCPQCSDHPRLKFYSNPNYRSESGVLQEGLICPKHHEICEYNFQPIAVRRVNNEWWEEGYKYPLTRLQVKRERAIQIVNSQKAHRESIKRSEELIKEMNIELVELTKEIEELQK